MKVLLAWSRGYGVNESGVEDFGGGLMLDEEAKVDEARW